MEIDINSHNLKEINYSLVLNTINQIYNTINTCDSSEDVAENCLNIIKLITNSTFGFISEMGSDGLLHNMSNNNQDWQYYKMHHNTLYNLSKSFRSDSPYLCTILNDKGCFTNNSYYNLDCITIDKNYSKLTSFLCVPFICNYKIVGLIGLGSCEGEYCYEDQKIIDALAPTIFKTIFHKRCSTDLENLEYKFNDIIKHTPTFIYDIDYKVAKFTKVSPLMCEYTGYTEEEFLALNPFDLMDENSKIIFQERINKCLNGTKPEKNVEYNIKTKDGRLLNVILNASFKLDENGIISGATIVGHDITERKKTELELIEANRSSEENRLILEAVIDQMPAGIILADASGNIVKSNKEMAKMWKRDMHPTENIFNHEYIAYHSDGRKYQSDEWPLSRSLLKQEVITGEEATILLGDDTKGTVLISSAPIKDKNGKIIAGIVIYTDVTERKILEASVSETQRMNTQVLSVQKQQLETLLKMKDEFLSLISHEFKTPITVINSAIQAMEVLCKDELTDKSRGFLSKIRQNSFRQLRLVNNLLDITRITSGHIKLNIKNHDIVFITKAIVESIYLYTEQKDIKLVFSSKIKQKVIALDEEKYERILLNLLSNAIKFSGPGKHILVTISSCREQVCIKVKDEGMGIPRDKQHIIFERFGQVNSSLSRQAEGTGIGLSLVKLFVESLGGSISVKSKIGNGSTFTILLPNIKTSDNFDKEDLQEISDNRLIQATAIEFSDIYL